MAQTMAPEVLAAQNRGPTVLTVTIIMLALSTVFVAVRMISRVGVVKKVSSDDYAIVLAWVGHLPYHNLDSTLIRYSSSPLASLSPSATVHRSVLEDTRRISNKRTVSL